MDLQVFCFEVFHLRSLSFLFWSFSLVINMPLNFVLFSLQHSNDLKCWTSKLKIVDFIDSHNFDIKGIFIWHLSTKIYFSRGEKPWCFTSMLVKLYIIFSSILTTSNIKSQNYKVVDLVQKVSSFDIIQERHYFSNATSASMRLLCCWNFILFFLTSKWPQMKN